MKLLRILGICIAITISLIACGKGSNGTYSSGTGIVLTLESGGKAYIEILGEKTALSYVVNGNNLMLTDSKGDTVNWRFAGDNTIIGPMGAELKKLK